MMQEYYRSALGEKSAFAELWNEFKFSSLPAMVPETLRSADVKTLISEVERGIAHIEKENNRLSLKLAKELEIFRDLLAASAVYSWCGACYVLLVTDGVLIGFYERSYVMNAIRAGSLLLRTMHEAAGTKVYLLVLKDAEKKEVYDEFSRFGL